MEPGAGALGPAPLRPVAEPPLQRRDVGLLDGKARGHGVAPKALQQIGGALQGLKDGQVVHAPAGALAHAVFQRDHKRGPAELVRQARGHNAHHALVPALAVEDDGPVVPALGQHPLHAAVKDLPLQRLALAVQLAQPLGQGQGHGDVVAQE